METLGDRLVNDCLQNEYWLSLQSKLELKSSLTEKETYDIIRFADIFSLSAQTYQNTIKIIKYIQENYNNQQFISICNLILKRINNF